MSSCIIVAWYGGDQSGSAGVVPLFSLFLTEWLHLDVTSPRHLSILLPSYESMDGFAAILDLDFLIKCKLYFHLKKDIGPLSNISVCFSFAQLYSSVEFGRRWQVVHEKVAPNRFYW
ncbi:hypothetical protein ATANTOWER_020197 [Ataeniobius toweri]|uniref:Uncharacterized protein n=1 Tax=Ataeniobius toweri TaxID=208326 RepID=A0ABU7BGM8_9TELE|nr:hypothetical protein [Ataeniobius toweri]